MCTRSVATVTADTPQAAPAAGHTGATAPAKAKGAAVCQEGKEELSGRSGSASAGTHSSGGRWRRYSFLTIAFDRTWPVTMAATPAPAAARPRHPPRRPLLRLAPTTAWCVLGCLLRRGRDLPHPGRPDPIVCLASR